MDFLLNEEILIIGNLYKNNKFEEVIGKCNHLVIDFPDNFNIWNYLGAAAFQTGDFDLAVSSFERAISLKKDARFLYNNVSLALQKQGKTSEAELALKKAAECLEAGDHHYKAYVGPVDRYDFMGASQFRLLTSLGLRSDHKLLDFGCGSLRAGKLFIPYLNVGGYYGQEPNQWLIDEAINKEVGMDMIKIKKPNFSNRDDFIVDFNENFDFIVAQSIFSHTDFSMTIKGLTSIFNSLSESGLALVTMIEGPDYNGGASWVYPGCTSYTPKTIKEMFERVGCFWRRLHWFHPAQTWYVYSRNKAVLPSEDDVLLLLGGEEVNSQHFSKQKFVENRLSSINKMGSEGVSISRSDLTVSLIEVLSKS